MPDRGDADASSATFAFLSNHPEGCVLRVRVVPRAGRTGLAGERAGALLVRLAAPPVEGAANQALVAFLSTCFDVPKNRVRIVSGERSRDKQVIVVGLGTHDARARLFNAGHQLSPRV